jgi:hypothetical protein
MSVDTLCPIWQADVVMTESENQFSLTRAASMAGGVSKIEV